MISNLVVPLTLILIAIAFVIVIRVMVSRYIKIKPDTVGIFYGRKYPYKDLITGKTKTRGFKVISSGGQILVPYVESYQEMSLAVFQVEADYRDIPNKTDRKINLKAILTCKISNTPEDLDSAAQAFLGKTNTEIAVFVQNILESHLRSTLDNQGINAFENNRASLTGQMTEAITTKLKQFGIQVIALVIKES